MNTVQSPPKLEAPGAGLPFPQSLLLRYFVGPFVSKKIPRDKVRSKYEHLTMKMLKAVEGVPVEKLRTRVLVDPIMGLEDSSRFWSAEQVFEHLLIVSKAIEAGILELAAGRKVQTQVSIAAVKPPGHEGALMEFKEVAPDLMKRLDQKLAAPGFDFDSSVTLDHPWFGPMRARQWYWLLSAHHAIHSKQLAAILRGV